MALPSAHGPRAASALSVAVGGYVVGLFALAAAFLGEGIFVSATADRVPWWAFFADLGALAPLALLGALLFSLVWWAWAAMLGRLEGDRGLTALRSPLSHARAWLSEGSAPELASRAASMLAFAAVLKLWVGATAFTARVLGESIVQGFYVALGSALAAFALLFTTALFFAPLQLLFAWPLRALARHPRTAWLTRPTSLLAALAVALGLAVAAFFALAPDTAEQMPWGFVLGPALGAAAVLLSAGPLTRTARRTHLSAVVGTALVGITGALTYRMPAALTEARTALIGQASLAAKVAEFVEARADHDRDGATAYFGGGDCAPRNAKVHPRAMEIPNNGVDEDCRFGDLTANIGAFTGGKREHPRPSGIAAQPNLLLITVDALSAPHTTLGGYARDVTPHLAAWAKNATVFNSAFAVSSGTRLVFPAFVAGEFDATVRMLPARSIPYPLHPDTRSLAGALAKAGYETAHIIPHSEFDKPAWGGYWMGFGEVDSTSYRSAKDKNHTSPEVTDAALRILERPRTKPLFLWVHFYDAHAPYGSPAGAKNFGASQVDRYDSEVHFQDASVGRLVEAARRLWRADQRVIVFTADHGEGFGPAHRKTHHGYTLDTEVLHIPLVVEAPWPEGHGKRLRGLASQLDLVPTFLNLAGVPVWPELTGESLVPSLARGVEPEKTVAYSLFYLPEDRLHDKDPFRMLGVRTKALSYVADYTRNAHLLVDWQRDPLEQKNLFTRRTDDAAVMSFLASKKLAWLREREQALKHVAASKTSKRKHQESKVAAKRAGKDTAQARPAAKPAVVTPRATAPTRAAPTAPSATPIP